MSITINLNKQARSLATQTLRSPEDLPHVVCKNIAEAVLLLAKKSRLNYHIDTENLQRILTNYVVQHPEHNNPINIVLTEQKKQAQLSFYDLQYRFEGMPTKPSLLNKHPQQPRTQQQGLFKHIPELGSLQLVDGTKKSRFGNTQQGLYQYIPELNHMEMVDGKTTFPNGEVQEGQVQYIPELNRMEMVDGKTSFPDGLGQEGQIQYIPELNRMALVNGKITSTSGLVQEGQFQYIPELNGMYLVDGKITLSNGEMLEGQFQYIPELNRMALVNGKITLSTGEMLEGQFQYIPELNGMYLVDGKTSFPDGQVQEGQRQYIPELNGMALVNGKITSTSGLVQKGQFQYTPELNGMYLVDGKITSTSGLVQKGQFQYIPELNCMRFVAGSATYTDRQGVVGRWSYNASLNNMEFFSELPERLQAWVQAAAPSENRAEAAQRIESVYAEEAVTLNLTDLGLTTLPPEIRLMVQLQELNLNNNQLTELPPYIGAFQQLIYLMLRHNPQLSTLPDEITQLPRLRELDLYNSQSLRSLPAGFERLPSSTTVDLQRTGLSATLQEAAARATELERATSHGMRGPQIWFSLPSQATRAVGSLKSEMLAWFNEVVPNTVEIPQDTQIDLLNNLPPDASQALATLLMRLRSTGQYTFAPQTMAARVCTLLTGLIEHPQLLEVCGTIILESTETCDDRTALGMLNMELALLEHQALNTALSSGQPKREVLKRLFEVGQGLFKEQALMDIAHQHAQRASGYVDETEILLKYLTRLGNDLQLPVKWSYMLYERFAFQVTEEDLALARERLKDSDRLDNPEFLNFMMQWQPFQTVLKQLEPQAVEHVERELNVIKQFVETKQEELFDEYELACEQHGENSTQALNLVTAMNENAAQIPPHSAAVWRNAMAWCLGTAESLQPQSLFQETRSNQNQPEIIAGGSPISSRTPPEATEPDVFNTQLTLAQITDIAGKYLSGNAQTKDAIKRENNEWKVQVKGGIRSKLKIGRSWRTLSKQLKKIHRHSPENHYCIGSELNLLLMGKLPRQFPRAANIMEPDNLARLKRLLRPESDNT